MSDFQGKVAVIVGGSSGIGAATARLLPEQGASVVIN
jgi:NAD(P)-dependent dehydrogenase (short-subunit alcohol dehydrogenase family)